MEISLSGFGEGPGPSKRSGLLYIYLQFREELRIPRSDDLLLDSVVVGAARAMAHAAIRPLSSRSVWSTKPSRKGVRCREVQVRRDGSTMSGASAARRSLAQFAGCLQRPSA